MRCSRCGACCQETEMLLSDRDAKTLEKAGYTIRGFLCRDHDGFARLRNVDGYCVFYDQSNRRCKAYRYRPLGCRIYPVILSEDDGIILDDLCPEKQTVSSAELKRKGKTLFELLKRIDSEAETRKNRHVNSAWL